MRAAKVVVLGIVAADVVARPVDDFPVLGGKIVDSITFHVGGCASNAAIGLARLGIESHLVASIGKDTLGQAMMQLWAYHGVQTQHVVQWEGLNSDIALVLVDSVGERRFIASPLTNHRLTPATLPDSALGGAFALHVAGFFALQGLEDGTLGARLAQVRARGILTTLDPVTGAAPDQRPAFYALLPHLDILLLNEVEGYLATGEQEVPAMIEALLSRGARTVILKRGHAGCIVAGEYGPLTLPAYPADTLDGTGAGDAFAAALLAALARGEGFEDGLRWASAAGAATVEAMGATGDWCGWDDLAMVMRRATLEPLPR